MLHVGSVGRVQEGLGVEGVKPAERLEAGSAALGRRARATLERAAVECSSTLPSIHTFSGSVIHDGAVPLFLVRVAVAGHPADQTKLPGPQQQTPTPPEGFPGVPRLG